MVFRVKLINNPWWSKSNQPLNGYARSLFLMVFRELNQAVDTLSKEGLTHVLSTIHAKKVIRDGLITEYTMDI